jgi:hypothetical protein
MKEVTVWRIQTGNSHRYYLWISHAEISWLGGPYLYLYRAVGVAFYGGSTLSFRPSDFGVQRLPRSTILERSRGGALATILRSDCPALLFWSGAVEELQRRYCGATAHVTDRRKDQVRGTSENW